MSAQHTLNIQVYNSVAEAPTFKPPEFLSGKIDYVNVVRKGTVEGRSTVDVVFETEDGQKFVVLLSGRLISSLATVIGED